MNRKLTHEQVDSLENLLREVQEKLEEAGQMVCGISGEDANHVWNRITSHAADVGDTIDGLYRLRPWG